MKMKPNQGIEREGKRDRKINDREFDVMIDRDDKTQTTNTKKRKGRRQKKFFLSPTGTPFRRLNAYETL